MSIRDELSEIPKPADIAVAMQRAAMLDIVFSEEAWLRCFDYQPKWSKNVVMAKYDNGGGNHLFVLFTGKDAVIKGFDHESEVSRHMRDDFAVWPGMYEGIPNHLNQLLDDDAIERDEVTFCAWHAGSSWYCGQVEFPEGTDDGTEELLSTIFTDVDDYAQWVEDYYERTPDVALLAEIFAGKKIDADVIASLNPDRKAAKALKELEPLQA